MSVNDKPRVGEASFDLDEYLLLRVYACCRTAGDTGEKFRFCSHVGSTRELSGGEAGLDVCPGERERGRGEERFEDTGDRFGDMDTGDEESDRLGTEMVRFSELRRLLGVDDVVSTSLRSD